MTLWWLWEALALRVALQWPTISLEARSSEKCHLVCCTILALYHITMTHNAHICTHIHTHTTYTYTHIHTHIYTHTHTHTHRVHGVSVDHTLEYFRQRVTEHLHALGVEGVSPDDILDLIYGYTGQGHGRSTQEELGRERMRLPQT